MGSGAGVWVEVPGEAAQVRYGPFVLWRPPLVLSHPIPVLWFGW